MMGTGKTSVARALGSDLGLVIKDTDRMVEFATGRRIREIFVEDGEEEFRNIETDQLRRALEEQNPCVIAAAGGTVLSRVNRDMMNTARAEGRAFVVWLTAEVDILLARTQRAAHRPLLDADPAAVLSTLAAARADLYESVSDIAINTTDLTASQVATAVIDLEEVDARRSGFHETERPAR
jgi:shikimate kinase